MFRKVIVTGLLAGERHLVLGSAPQGRASFRPACAACRQRPRGGDVRVRQQRLAHAALHGAKDGVAVAELRGAGDQAAGLVHRAGDALTGVLSAGNTVVGLLLRSARRAHNTEIQWRRGT